MGINSPKSVIVVASGCPAELIQELLNGRTLPQQTDFAVLLPPGEQKQYDNLINRNSLRKTQFLSKPSKGFFSINYLRWLWDNLRSAENTYVLITKSPYQDPIVALISLTVLMLSDKAITLLFATPEAVIDLNGQGLSERWISQELNFKILVSEFYRIFWFLNPWNILYFFMIGGLILRQSLAKIMGRCLTRNRNQKNLTGTQEQEVLRKKYQDGGDDNPKPPYRVLHVIDQLGIGGAQEVVCQLVKYSQHDLFHPEVLALRGLGRYMDVLQSWGVPVYSLLPENHKIYSYFGGLSAHLLSKLFLFLTTRRYDLVHTHLLWSNMYATPMAAFCRVPVRFNHDQAYDFVRYRTGSNRFLRAISNRLTSHIIAVSYSIRNFLCQEENVSADKITVVHNSVDLNLFSPQNGLATRERMRKKWDLPPGALIVGGVGRLEQQKNFSLFLEVAAEVCAQLPQARFVIAGEGHDRSLLEDLSRKL